MKKYGILFLMLILLLMAAPMAFAEETVEPAGHTDHCVCGGSAVGIHESHSCEVVQWQPIPEGTTDIGALDSGNYYLTGDLALTGSTDIQGKTLSICLNGCSITTTKGIVFGKYLQTGTTLNICDCSYDAVTGTWDGTVTGGTDNFGAVIWADDGAKVNIFGGNLVGNGKHTRRGGVIYVSGKTLEGAYTGASNVNLYNGVISGGKAGQGGNIFINCKAEFNMYGGTVTGGKASYIKNGNNTYNGHGGNIMIDSTGTMNMYGGKVTNGEAIDNGSAKNRGCGGNIAVSGVFNMYGGEVSYGKALTNPTTKKSTDTSEVYDAYSVEVTGCGGNIVSFWSSGRINIMGGSVFGGEANGLYGGNIFLGENANCQLNISGGKIWGGVANADESAENTTALCYGSDVKGGSIAVIKGNLSMTGGSVGIDANGNAAGGTVYPAGGCGGNIYLASTANTVSITGGTVANGVATSGGNIYTAKALTISGATVTGGKATNDAKLLSYGGNIYSTAATTITSATITYGEACHGGNIIQYGATLDLTNSTVTHGKADLVLDGKTNGNGGNIYVDKSCVATITGCTITDGQARRGGNLAVLAATTISGGSITDGYAVNGGGNIFVYGAAVNLTIQDSCQIADGTTDANGGNLLSSGIVSISDSTVSGGKANADTGVGGSLYAGGDMTVTRCTVTGGDAQYGGALAVAKDKTLSVVGSTVSTATGGRGRAAYVAKGGTLSVTDSSMNNIAKSGGTCIWNCGTLILVGTVDLNDRDIVTTHTSDLMLDNRDGAEAYVDITGLTGQDEPYLFRRYGTVGEDTAGLVAIGAAEEQLGMFTPWNNNFLVTYSEGQILLTAGVVQARAGSAFAGVYATWEDAMADSNESITMFKLLADQTAAIEKNMILDLNGFNLTATVAEGVILTAIDSATDDYDITDGYGVLSLAADSQGTVASMVKTDKETVGAVKRYLAVAAEDGALSFHRFFLGITKMSLKPGVTGVGYKAQFYGDELVLGQVKSYGYNLWIGDGEKLSAGKTGAFTSGKEVTLRLQNFDVANYGTAAVNAEVYLELADGTVVTGTAYSYTLKGMLESIAEDVSGFTAAQISALQTMCNNNAQAMADWKIESILNWTATEEA